MKVERFARGEIAYSFMWKAEVWSEGRGVARVALTVTGNPAEAEFIADVVSKAVESALTIAGREGASRGLHVSGPRDGLCTLEWDSQHVCVLSQGHEAAAHKCTCGSVRIGGG